MTTISKPNTFSANTTISSAAVNANFDTLYNDYNGGISAANLAANAVTTAKIADANVTTAKIADANITSAKLATGAVGAANIATGTILLGISTPITTQLTTGNTSVTQATGITCTVTVPTGGRTIKVTLTGGVIANNTGAKNTYWSIWRGTVGSGTQIGGTQFTVTTSNYSTPAFLIAPDTPSAGSITYNLGYYTDSGGTAIIQGAASAGVILIVEAM